MLVCFGFSWPFSILKTWRSKSVKGKSLLFLSLVLVGYFAGMIAKFVRAAAPGGHVEVVIWLYPINALLVATDLMLYLKYSRDEKARIADILNIEH